jgi:hypothetical protein
MAPSSLCIEIRVHITGSSRESPLWVLDGGSGDKKEEDKRPTLVLGLTDVKVKEGRPDIEALLQEEVGTTTGRLFVSGMYLYITWSGDPLIFGVLQYVARKVSCPLFVTH